MSTFALIIATFVGTLVRRLLVLGLVFGMAIPVPEAVTEAIASNLGRHESYDARRAAGMVRIIGASDSEAASIRQVLASERYPVDPHLFTIEVVNGLPIEGAGAVFEWPESVIRLDRAAFSGRPITGLARILAHELGHVFDRVHMTPSARAKFLELRGYSGTTNWQSERQEWARRPAEDFAEVFAHLTQPLSIASPTAGRSSLRNKAALMSLLDSVSTGGVTTRIPSVFQHWALRTAAGIADLMSDSLVRMLLLVGLFLGALLACRHAWRNAMRIGRKRRRVLALRSVLQ